MRSRRCAAIIASAAAESLNNPEHYVMAVMATRPVPSPEAKAAALEMQP